MKKILLIVLPIIIIIGGLLGGGYYIYDNTINTNVIYDGVKIDELDVGGKTKTEALTYIKDQKEVEDTSKAMNLSYEEHSYDISLKDFGYSYNFESAVDEAFEIGRDGNPFERYKIIKDIEKNGKTVALEPNYDRDLVLKVVDKISDEINQESVDAKFNFNNGNIQVTEDKTGKNLKKSELINLIVDNIYELEDIILPVEITEPKYKKDFLGRINGVIGEFSTSFKGSSAGRVHNIKLSASSLSNKLIMPGEQVSYNETTGPRQAQLGYQEATVIVNGELTPGMGGGVCQTSTTLYNALLLANLTILERHPHSIAAAYVPRGTDGAVATGYLDLKFRNDYDFPIYTYSKVVGDRLHFYIYGDKNRKDYTIKIEPVLVQTIPYKIKEVFDAKAVPGSRIIAQEGRTGYKVKTYKSIIKDGKVLEKTQITSDYYRERDFIYKVGPTLPAPVVPVPAPVVPAPVVPPVVPPVTSIDPIVQPIDPEEIVVDLLP